MEKDKNLNKIILKGLIQIFELPTDESTGDGDHYLEVEDTPGYQVAYSQLNFAQTKNQDPLSEFSDPRKFLVESLQRLSQSRQADVQTLLAGLHNDHKQALQKYCSQYGVQLI